MPPSIATIIFAVGILGLFYLDRHKDVRVSNAVWVPAAWLFLLGSRPVSEWLGIRTSFTSVDATAAYIEGSPIDRAVFTFLLLAALVVLIARIDRMLPWLRKNALIVAFFIFCAASILWSDFPFVAFKRWIKAVGDLGMVLIILTEADPMAAVERLLTRLGFLLFPLSVLYIKYFPSSGRRLTNSWTLEATGVTLQKNSLGLDCMIYGVFFLWMIVSVYRERGNSSRPRRLLAYGTITAMILWLLYQCNSTTSIAGLAAAGGVMWLAARPSRKLAFVHLVVFAVFGMAVTALFFNAGGGMLEAVGKDPTLTGRTKTWGLVLSLHSNPWVGTGFESFWLGSRLEAMRSALPNFPITQAHNGYLEVYLNLGWAGICFLGLLLLTGYKRLASGLRQNPHVASLLLGLFLCTIFESFTENAFRMMTLSWISLLLVIMAASRVLVFGKWLQNGSVPDVDIASTKKQAYATMPAQSLAE